jgi:hypothetical protein
MVLSDDILDDQGQVLLPKDTVLTERMIGLLPAHGIEMVAVCLTGGASPADQAQIQARIDHLFRKNDPDDAGDFATGILRRYVLDYRLNREIEQ